jgi:hypothetical protein
MKRRALYISLILINILVIIFFLIQYTNATYPLVGHDYRQHIAFLIDSHLYYKVNGFNIEWYTPNFGGGLPAYPNPLQLQFSLPQLVTWFINPYDAIFISMAIYIAIGFTVSFFFLRNVLELKPLSAILGADFFLINGFLIERVVVGHINFLTFPLIIVPIYALLNPKIPQWVAGILISIIGAVLVYSGGVYIAVIGCFSALMLIPILYFMKPELFSWRRILGVLSWAAILTALLCGSKLYATASYMRFFSRTAHDQSSVNWIKGLLGMILQLVGTMNWYPLLALLHKTSASYTVRLSAWTRTPYGFWELDSSLAPGLLFLLCYGVIRLFFHKLQIKWMKIDRKKIFAGLILLFGIILTVEFAISKGFLYVQLKELPVLISLHADTRFTSAFILPLAIVGAKVFNGWTARSKSGAKQFIAFAILSGISLASMWSYYLMPFDKQARFFYIPSFDETYRLASAGEVLPVQTIVPDMNDYEVFEFKSSNITHHYDTLFGNNNYLLTPLVHEGSVFDIQDGYYNMTNPSSLVFPEVNGTKLFERIPVSDTQKFLDFINRRASDWKLPLGQIILDWAAGITLILEILALFVQLIGKWIPFLTRIYVPLPRQRSH